MDLRKTAGDLEDQEMKLEEGEKLQEEEKPNRFLGKQEKNRAEETRGPQIERGQGRKQCKEKAPSQEENCSV